MRKLLNGIAVAVLALSTVLVMQGCNEEEKKGGDGAAAGPPKVIATTSMIADIVTAVGGDLVGEVEVVIAPGLDPHTYQPKLKDIELMSKGDIIFYNGMVFEAKMTESFTEMGRQGKKVWAVTEEYDESDKLFPEGEDHADPHVWMDVALWIKSTDLVAKALSEYDPANKAKYEENATAYKAKLTELKAYVDKVMTSIPKEKRVLITAHDAFGYMGRAFDIEVMGVQGISTENEAGLKEITDLVDFIVKNKIETVFIETSVSEKGVQTIVERAKAQGQPVEIGGVLFSDSAGEPGTYEGSYVGMIDHNATTLANSLGGEAPEKGFQDKLTGVKH